MKTVFKLADKVAVFKAKLELWGRRVNKGIFDMFHTLAGILGETESEHSFSQLISQEFYREFGFPGVYGALDCSLIKILSPGGSLAETFRCRKGFFALNVQTVSDLNLSNFT
ncbi:hypothetical protein TNIN_405401 [Trichonephila inaurata madagascariensis]|uniref:Uncharacterized protein n=1 Tax=Trichonephila inaurata madagascariensis TaxID=2747483 RepID=A0A8X6WTH6_9ARAC|nr:hypothetical protein TNIN_405401 [Trichonephila inaurata madagascariensis]